MNITFWVATLFSITVVLWLLGYHAELFDIMTKYTNDPSAQGLASNSANEMLTAFINSILNWNTALLVVALAGGALLGLNLLALIPLGAIILILNFTIFPISAINSAGLPPEVSIPLTAFFTLTEIMIVFSLIRGSFR